MNGRRKALILVGTMMFGIMAMGIIIPDANYVETWTHGSEELQFEVQSKDEGRLRVEIKVDGKWQVLLDEPINNGKTTFTRNGFSEKTTIRLACTWKKGQELSSPAGNGKWNDEHTVLFAQWDFTGSPPPEKKEPWLDQTVTMSVIN